MILDGGGNRFLSDGGITSVASDACKSNCVVEVLENRASVVMELTTVLDWLLLTPSWGSCTSVRCIM